jgi:hypothetical protein
LVEKDASPRLTECMILGQARCARDVLNRTHAHTFNDSTAH